MLYLQWTIFFNMVSSKLWKNSYVINICVTVHSPNVDIMLGQGRSRWHSIIPTLGQFIVLMESDMYSRWRVWWQPANTKHLHNIFAMLGQRGPTLHKCYTNVLRLLRMGQYTDPERNTALSVLSLQLSYMALGVICWGHSIVNCVFQRSHFSKRMHAWG